MKPSAATVSATYLSAKTLQDADAGELIQLTPPFRSQFHARLDLMKEHKDRLDMRQTLSVKDV